MLCLKSRSVFGNIDDGMARVKERTAMVLAPIVAGIRHSCNCSQEQGRQDQQDRMGSV